MALWRVHVELEDRPGRLGELATAVGAAGCNILHLHLVGEPADDGSVTDELLVRMPEGPTRRPCWTRCARPASRARCWCRPTSPSWPTRPPRRSRWPGWSSADPGSAPGAAASLLRARLVDPAGPDPTAHTCTPAHRRPAAAAGPGLAVHRHRDLPGGRAAASWPPSWRCALRSGRRPPSASCCCATARRCRCAGPSRRTRRWSPRCTRGAPRSRGEPGSSARPRSCPRRSWPSCSAASPVRGAAVLAVTTDGGSAVGVATLATGAGDRGAASRCWSRTPGRGAGWAPRCCAGSPRRRSSRARWSWSGPPVRTSGG